MTQSMLLLAMLYTTENEANLLFYKGILRSMCKKIGQKIPDAHQTDTSAPSIISILGYLRNKFNINNINGNNDMDFYSGPWYNG